MLYEVITSLHSSKGLEFDHVFLVGVEEEYLPHTKSISEAMDVDEERRLCYVGITRARKTLTLSSCEQRRKFGKLLQRIPSRFLEEIPDVITSYSIHYTKLYEGRAKMTTRSPASRSSR